MTAIDMHDIKPHPKDKLMAIARASVPIFQKTEVTRRPVSALVKFNRIDHNTADANTQ